MSNILVFDASSSWCSASLSIDGSIISAAEEQPRKHAQLIMPMIEDICQQSGIKPSQLDGIAFGKGPGSFTGLRIAISVAQGLSIATGAKLYGISSLEALAWQAMKSHDADHVLSIMNAHMGEVFYSAYQRASSESSEQSLLFSVIDDALSKPESVEFSSLESNKQWFGAGDGYQFISQMPEVELITSVYEENISPMAESMMDIALNAWERDLFTSAELQQPVYLRDTVAWKKLSEQPSLLKK